MTRLTIVEALQEVKTLQARIAKKREAIIRYFARDARLKDPLEGGTQVWVQKERQGIGDLEERIVQIRTLIQQANQIHSLTVNGVTRTVAAWLNWRRDVSEGAKQFLNLMAAQVTAHRNNATRQGQVVTDKESGAPNEILIAVKEQELASQVEHMETVLGSLDGKLSLVNATMYIEL